MLGARGEPSACSHTNSTFTLNVRPAESRFAQLHGLDSRDTVDRALDAAGLADQADDDVSGFSRGMRQRLASSTLHEPRLV